LPTAYTRCEIYSWDCVTQTGFFTPGTYQSNLRINPGVILSPNNTSTTNWQPDARITIVGKSPDGYTLPDAPDLPFVWPYWTVGVRIRLDGPSTGWPPGFAAGDEYIVGGWQTDSFILRHERRVNSETSYIISGAVSAPHFYNNNRIEQDRAGRFRIEFSQIGRYADTYIGLQNNKVGNAGDRIYFDVPYAFDQSWGGGATHAGKTLTFLRPADR
jgi:hypothetical protein